MTLLNITKTMHLYHKQFLDIPPEFTAFAAAKVALLPFPYEGGISYGAGTGKAPNAVLDASCYVELYDELLDVEPFRVGVSTLAPPPLPQTPEGMIQTLYEQTAALLKADKFVIVIGGDHSISSGFAKALLEKYGRLSVIQLDAHADLRESYEGNPLSHASVMARMRELTPRTLQIGIRSLSIEEAQRVKREQLAFFPMHRYRSDAAAAHDALRQLPDPVFLTIDVDVFDWSVIFSTGTPEPGGMTWDEAMGLLRRIFAEKQVVGADVVELSCRDSDQNSPFAVAKLIYKLIGFKYFVTSGQISPKNGAA